ncbi:MAG TPA: hypothetical protein VM557_05055 [Thermoanaerobaculia bacterium]|nr:hypothetical protein [Thermoanaerobaculia bacterium]
MLADSTETFRVPTTADIPRLQTLFEEVFREERDERIWRWKYFDNPRGQTSLVCEAAGRVIAHCGGIPVRFRDYDSDSVALQSVDFMSSPSYPGGSGRGGVFVRTADRFFATFCGPAKVPLVYGFPGERHRILGERVLGYRPVEPVGELRLESRKADASIESLTEGDLSFFSRVPFEMGAFRDPVYLRWRYLDHPLNRYGKVAIRRPFGMGMQIAALVRRAGEVVYVMEVAGRFSRRNSERLVAQLARLGSPVVFWGPPSHPVTRTLSEAGFSVTARDHWFELRSFTQRPLPRPGGFYYTLGDYDVY